MSAKYIVKPAIRTNNIFNWNVKVIRKRVIMLTPDIPISYIIGFMPFVLIGIFCMFVGFHDFYWRNYFGGTLVLMFAAFVGMPGWIFLWYRSGFVSFDIKKELFHVGNFQRNKIKFSELKAIEIAVNPKSCNNEYYDMILLKKDGTKLFLLTQQNLEILRFNANFIAQNSKLPLNDLI